MNKTAAAPEGNDWNRAIARIDSMEDDPERHIALQIDRAVREAVQAAKRTGKKSSVSVKISFTPGPDRRIELSSEVKKTLPAPPTSKVSAYANPDDGSLHDFDPFKAEGGLPGITAAPPRATATVPAGSGE